jgi:hypothetical protein
MSKAFIFLASMFFSQGFYCLVKSQNILFASIAFGTTVILLNLEEFGQ